MRRSLWTDRLALSSGDHVAGGISCRQTDRIFKSGSHLPTGTGAVYNDHTLPIDTTNSRESDMGSTLVPV